MQWNNLFFRKELHDTDPEVIRKIVRSSGFFNKQEVKIAVELSVERLIKKSESGYYFIMAECDGDVLGYSCFGPVPCTKSSFDLYWIAMHNNYRGLGMGQKLLKETILEIHKLEGKKIYAETSSRDRYRPTRVFYEKNNFSLVARIRDFYDEGDDKLVYCRKLK